jgi:uncharacterized protein YndB with AHSA1/START domain
MTVIQESIEIRAPIDRVFAAITDPRRTMEWNTSIAGVTELQGYPPRLDTTWKQIAVVAGRQARLDCRIVAWAPPHEGVLQISGDQRARVVTRCEPVADGTRVTQIVDFVPPGGLLGSLASGVIGGALRRELAQSLQRQRDTLQREIGGVDGPRP